MIHMTLAQTASILGLNGSAPQIEWHGISLDSRTITPGNLFIAVPGARVDGHDFIEEAYQKGAAAALVLRSITSDLPQLIVDDIPAALGKIAAHWRNQFNIPFVAVTGSNGKTTLKNMINAILIAACNGNQDEVLATQGNFNNFYGLPLTLARLNEKHRYAVIEMGMNHFGEIEYLSRLTRPTVAVITNAGTAHLEGVGDLAGVARAKSEIFLGLQENGTAILNRDDAFYHFWREQIGQHRFLTFGFHSEADVTGKLADGGDKPVLMLSTPKGTTAIHMPLLGKHNVLNTFSAAASALALGIELDVIKAGLEAIHAAPGRLQLHSLANGVNIIDDTYNANPYSLAAAVETLATFAGKKILVLGDMKELGNEAKIIHADAGKNIRAAGIDYLFTFGELSAFTAQTFGEGAYHFNEQEKLVTALKPFLYKQTTILVKGSRSMRMEKVVTELMQ
jgi:UDP-N-acetylmuramoyl-tripeptide--D-alanyl-D-alanine ligase